MIGLLSHGLWKIHTKALIKKDDVGITCDVIRNALS